MLIKIPNNIRSICTRILESNVWPTVKLLKWFLRLNHFHSQINKGHLKKAGGYSGRNVVLQITITKMRTTVWKMTHKSVCLLSPPKKKMKREVFVWNSVMKTGFNPRSRHIKDFKNATWYSLLNTQQYKVRIKGKEELLKKGSSALPYTSV